MSESDELGIDISNEFVKQGLIKNVRVMLTKVYAPDRSVGLRKNCKGTVTNIIDLYGTKMVEVKFDCLNTKGQLFEVLVPCLYDQLQLLAPNKRKK